ncbi:MAG: nucleotidyltransferase domain-containing protein [Gemmatimonadota bacterium]
MIPVDQEEDFDMAIDERWKGHPPLPDDLEMRLPAVVARLRRAGADLVYRFGSTTGGKEPVDESKRRPADLDLAIWGLEEDPWGVRADLEQILGTDRLDLVRLESADPELRFRIVSSGQRLYAESPQRENEVELRILREHQDLGPFRRVQRRYLRARHEVDGP